MDLNVRVHPSTFHLPSNEEPPFGEIFDPSSFVVRWPMQRVGMELKRSKGSAKQDSCSTARSCCNMLYIHSVKMGQKVCSPYLKDRGRTVSALCALFCVTVRV